MYVINWGNVCYIWVSQSIANSTLFFLNINKKGEGTILSPVANIIFACRWRSLNVVFPFVVCFSGSIFQRFRDKFSRKKTTKDFRLRSMFLCVVFFISIFQKTTYSFFIHGKPPVKQLIT